LIIIKHGELIESDNIDNLVEKVRGKVFETVVNQEIFNSLNIDRKIIHRKQEGENIKVRYVGDEYEGVINKLLEPSLEDYYVSTCL
ncbi:MAG: hypothetical protein ACRCXT_21580, partial [Paraclostridium sp.]